MEAEYERELRMRCIEAAARNPQPHADGYTAGVLAAAKTWADWVFTGVDGRKGQVGGQVNDLM